MLGYSMTLTTCMIRFSISRTSRTILYSRNHCFCRCVKILSPKCALRNEDDFNVSSRRKYHSYRNSIITESYSSRCQTKKLGLLADCASLYCKPFSRTIHLSHKTFFTETKTSRSQLSSDSLIESFPVSMQPYLRLVRLDKPIGTWLLFLPCSWSIGMAACAGCFPSLWYLSLFALGSVVMRGAGCSINDFWDVDIDKKVERTKTRPLAAGEISYEQALLFIAAQLSLGLSILFSLNGYSIILGASSMGLVLLYPLMKRITFWPQIVLGLAFNWGALLGWSAVQGSCDWSICLPLYVAGIAWTMVYDTIYAHQDKVDDILVGVKSTALKFGDNSQFWLFGFSGIMLSNLALSGYMAGQTWPYYSSIACATAHLIWQIKSVSLNNPVDCLRKFKSNMWLGILIFTGIVLGTKLKDSKPERDTTCRTGS